MVEIEIVDRNFQVIGEGRKCEIMGIQTKPAERDNAE